MPKKLLVLGAMLVLVSGMAAPALAQDQDEVPACVLAGACLEPTEERAAEHQYESEGDTFSVTPAPDDIDQPFEVASEGNGGFQYNGLQGCDAYCIERVVQAARDAVEGEGSDSEAGTDPAAAFSAAMDAALSPGGTGEVAASEQAESPTLKGREAVAYRAAFEAAKASGLDDEASLEAAKEAAEVAVAEASKTQKGGSPSEGIAAAEGKTSEASKDRSSKDTAGYVRTGPARAPPRPRTVKTLPTARRPPLRRLPPAMRTAVAQALAARLCRPRLQEPGLPSY